MGDTLPRGTLLNAGTFRIESVLGRGGFGVTYQSHDVKLGTPVAIKEFLPAGLCEAPCPRPTLARTGCSAPCRTRSGR